MDIKPIGKEQRNLKGIDFFILWAGVGISLAEIWAGGFLSSMGFWMGLWAILLGHIIGNTVMALGGVIGSDHGIMSMVSIRPAFGIRGSNLAAVLNIIQLVGWASIMLIIGGRAGAMIGNSTGGILADNRFWIVLIGMGTLMWALFTGKAIWKKMQTIAVVALTAVIIVMTWASFKKFGAGLNIEITGDKMPFMSGLDIVIAMPISWLPLVADYSRIAKSTKSAFWNTWWGYFIISSWMYLLGLMATLVTGDPNPDSQILQLMGSIGLAMPALIMVVFSTITSDFPDVYSATCSMLNISQKISAKVFMWIVGIVSILIALVFPAEQYENFLLIIGAMFMPLFGVVLTDYFIIRNRHLEVDQLFEKGGKYWYSGGFHFSAILSWVIGFVVYEWITLSGYTIGASIPSMIVAGLLYFMIEQFKPKGA